MQKLTWKFLVFIVIITGIFCYTQVSANITNINPSFDTKIPAGFDQDPNAMVIQSDGKIVIGGMFNSYQGITTNKIIRLNSDGTKDSSFIMGSGFNDMVWALALQSDGKIIVGGMFTNYSGVTANRIIRLNSDGTKDNTFNIGSGCNDMVKQIIIQSDGKIIVVGNFATYSGVTANRIIRLNSDGTKDNTFNIGTAFDMSPNTMTIQSDGKIIVVGNFATYSGITTNKIVRLNTDGTKDNTFNIGTSFDMDPNTIAIQSDGKIILGGNFSMYSGVTANKIIRLNTGGTKDNTFNIGTSFDMSPNTIAIQSDGKIMVGGMFSIYSGAIANKIIRLNTDGTKDNTFAMGIGFNNPVGKIIIQNDEKIFIQGYFTAYNGTTANKVVRLHSDGTKDTSFIIGNGLDSYVNAIAIQNDGKVIAGGQFSVYSGITANKIVRLNTDGTKDSTLNIGDGFNQSVQAITIQNDGKILVGGWFTTYSGVSANYITRLNSDGTKDNTFNIGNGLNGAVNIFALQSDGKIIVGGQFSTYSGVTANGIVRLNTNGTKDASFLIGNGFAGQVVALALQGDGKVVAGGWFTSYSGSAVNYIVRLNSTGSKDTSFLIGSGFNSVVRSLKIQSDGKIIAGGMFTTYNGVTANGIIRLATNGINDGLFTVGSGFNYAINALAIQNTNGILVGGNFTTYNGVAAGYLVSLYGDSDVVILPNSTDTTTIVNRFTSKGYIQASGDLVGSKGISLTETNGNIPAALSLRNQDIKLTIPADTQFKKTDNVIPYNGIVSVPITKNISSVDNEQVISSFKVGSTSESIKLTGGVATLSVLASGKNIGDLVQIYYSEDNGVTRYPQTMGFVTNQNGLPYVSFTTNHFTDFAVTVPSGSFTGTFIINSGAVSTVSTGVILTISVAPAPTFMRFSNDGVNRSAREAYGISKSRSLGTGYGEKTVYVEFDTNGDGIYDIQTNDSITYVAPRSITYNKPAGTMTNSDVIATFTLNDSGTIVGTGIYTFTGNGTHTFDFLDASGTVGTAIATVTWIDKIAPVITINGISPMYIEYGLPYTEIGALWSDNNDGGGVVSAIAGSVNNLILGTYTITYTKIDVAGNTGTATRTVIVRDTIAPVVTLNGAATIYVEYGNTYAELGANWVDSRDGGGVVSSITGTVNISVLGTYTLTYTKIDTAGNTGTATRTVIVRDTTAPVVTLNGAATIYVEYGSTYTELGATWTDLRDGTGVVSIISGSVNTGTLGTYTLTYRKVDAAGNTGTINRSVVIRDTTAPVLTLNGAAIIYVEYGSSYTELGATWTDLRDGAGTVSIISGSVNTGLLGTYTLTYKRVDAAGNTGTINRSVVVRDTTAPVVTLNGAAIVYVEYGSIYTELGAISTDLHDGTGPAIISGVVNTGVIGTYTLTYKKVDVAGNTGNTVTRTVIVRDTTIPEITAVTLTPNMLGAIAQITITQTISDFNGTNGASVYLLGPDGFTDTVALSLVSGDTHNGVRSGIYIFPAPATAIDGTYYISGSAIDLANNTGYHEIGQIILDRTAPTFSVVSITPNYVGVTGLVTINVSAQDMTLGISGINIKDVYSDISATLVSGTTFPTSPQEMGSWIFTQSVVGGEDIHIEEIITTDIVGNTRTATGSFIYDITAPILTLSGSNLIYIEYNSSYIELGATWTDEVDGSGVASNISGTVNTLSIGNYEILYSQEDRAGNVGTATRTVIVKDTIAPVVTLNGASTIYVEYGNDYSELGATWTDNVEGSGMVSMISGVVNTGVLGNYIVTYKKIDISNNTGTATRTVVVRDTTSPVVMLNGLGTVNIAYGNTYTELGATWNDLHDGTGNAISSGIVNTSIIGPYTIEYYRVDQSSNTGNIFRTVNVISAPIIPSVPSGGNGGSSILKKDTCPVSRDCSDSYYDSLCGKCSLVEKIVDKIPFHGAANKQSGSIAGSSFPLELNNAYLRAYGYNITTMPTIQRANMQGPLLRKDMAKMISSFAMNVLGKNVSTGANCTFSDMSSLPKEMQYYGIAACRLGLMGYASDGITLNKNFNPDEEVDRAQFGTILSRLLRGDKNNGGILYYQKHLQALKSEGIMTKIDTPLLGEMRGRVMVMMQRIFEKK